MHSAGGARDRIREAEDALILRGVAVDREDESLYFLDMTACEPGNAFSVEFEKGKWTAQEVLKPGPTVMITTAVRRLGAQLDSRLFSLEIPDDQDQVRLALHVQARIELEGSTNPDPELIAFQGLLQAKAPWEVVVPFVEKLVERIGRSPSATRVLRDFQRLLSLVKAVTVMRHAHRERDEKGRLVATLEDYKPVFELVEDMYESSVTGASKMLRRVVDAVRDLEREGKAEVSMKMVAEKLGVVKSTVSRYVKTAESQGWIVNLQEVKGRSAKLKIGEPLPDKEGLPDPRSLEIQP